MWNGSAWVPQLMEGRLLGVNVYTSQDGTWNSKSTSGASGTWNKPSGCSNVWYMSQVVAVVQESMITHIVVQVAVAVVLLLNGLTCQVLVQYHILTVVVETILVMVVEVHQVEHHHLVHIVLLMVDREVIQITHIKVAGGNASGGDIILGGGEMAHGAHREGGGGSSFWHKAGSNHHCANNQEETLMVNGGLVEDMDIILKIVTQQ